MKRITPYILLLFFVHAAHGQHVVNSLFEDFNTACADFGPNYPNYWTNYNNREPKIQLSWNCAPLSGRYNSPGISCNAYYGGRYYLDTAWLFTPLLSLRDEQDRIFLRYDSRYEFLAAKLSVMVSYDYNPGEPPINVGVDWVDLSSSLNPVISVADSQGWVTHWVELTSYKAVPFYVAFRYVSDTLFGGTWTIDNVMTTRSDVGIHDKNGNSLPLTIIGSPTTEEIRLSTTILEAGIFKANVYDNLGRKVLEQDLQFETGNQYHTLSGCNLAPGMYLLKLDNGLSYGVCKLVVH